MMEAEKKYCLSQKGLALCDYLFCSGISEDQAIVEIQQHYGLSVNEAKSDYFVLKTLWESLKKEV
jgi:hypothetical protein